MRGYTLLEVLLAVGIFVVIGAGLSGLSYLYISYGQLLPEGRLGTEVFRQQQMTLEEFLRAGREAEEILATTTADGTTYTSGTTTVVLRLLAIDSSGNTLDNKFDDIIFYATSSNPISLYKRITPDAASARKGTHPLLNNAVEGFSITYNKAAPKDSTKMQIYLVTKKTSANITQRATSTIEVTLRP